MADETSRNDVLSGTDRQALIERVQYCPFILCLDVPEGTEVGLDNQLWVVGPKFKGIKLIPPNCAHFFYYSAGDRSRLGGEMPPARRGRFLYLKPREVAVFQWKPQLEDFVDLAADEALHLAEAVHRLEFDQWLGPYPMDSSEKWFSISGYITPDVLERLQPVGQCVWSEMATQQAKHTREKNGDGSAISDVDHKSYYTDIPKRAIPPGAAPHEVTRYSTDKSYLLSQLLQNKYNNNYKLLLGELEYSFICFIMGQEYEGFIQWKNIVSLLCSCEDALQAQPKLFCDFIGVLHHQLQQAPVDLFADELTADSFLMSSLKSLCELTDNVQLDSNLVRCAQELRTFLSSHFGLDLSNTTEIDEDSPIIVPEEDLHHLQ